MRSDLPAGTVTFLFTDVEGSTKLLDGLGAEGYAAALAEHRRIVRHAFGAHAGVEVDTQGDAFFVAFPTAPAALRAAAEALGGLAAGPIRVRMGIHTGTPHVTDEGYVGADVHRAARIAACGHGGQVLVSASTAALVDPDGLRDLGEHRLKDLSAPERIYQLGADEFPPLKSLYQTNLPVPATPFVGRERELEEVLGLLGRGDVRLLTLTGPGGTGKTRLALQAAAGAADDHPHGVWWVPLGPLRDPQLVLETAGAAIGAKDGLAEHIGDRSLLLLLDNFEHVIEAAPGLAGLLAACPNLQLLVSSRELLRVPGEQAYAVPPLDPEEGTELFLARARAAVPDFQASAAVPELCARLEQLPLALELAAARVAVLSPEQLLERLALRLDLLKAGRGVDPRQQTLRATIEWSHELLRPEEQRLFARLAVFRGGCSLEAAEGICEADLDDLQSLVDKSLVRHTGERFWMLETIREFAAERLEASGEGDDIRLRHAEFFLALAEEAGPQVAARPQDWLGPMERESDNFRAALDRLEDADAQRAVRLAGALWYFWYIKGHIAEGRRRLEAVLAQSPQRTAARGIALNGATATAIECGDIMTARARADEAMAINRELGNAWGIARSGFLLGQVIREEGNLVHARALFEDSVRRFREVGDEHFELLAMTVAGWMDLMLGERDRSRAAYEQVLRRARAAGMVRIEANALIMMAEALCDEGETDRAVALLKRAYAIQRNLGAQNEIATLLTVLATALAGRAPAGAARLLGCAGSLFSETGASAALIAARNAQTLAAIGAHLDERALTDAQDEGRALTPDAAVDLALEEAGIDA
ncbi:MAG: adenylate/guanylate cyclase domain-containing protein [Gaiellaceae bacterium]